MAGVRTAKEGILTFLDSHVEAAPGWLPPLIKTIQTDRKVSGAVVNRGFPQLGKMEASSVPIGYAKVLQKSLWFG